MKELENLLDKLEEKIFTQYYKKISKVIAESKESLHFKSFIYLDIIASLENPTYSQVAECLDVSRPAVTQMVNPLIDTGYVVKTRDKDDKRTYRLRVTEKFIKYHLTDIEHSKEILEKIDKALSVKEKEQMLNIMKKIEKALD